MYAWECGGFYPEKKEAFPKGKRIVAADFALEKQKRADGVRLTVQDKTKWQKKSKNIWKQINMIKKT